MDEMILRLADYGLRLESFFGLPQDVEWAQDLEGKLFILQSRPLHFLESGGKTLAPEATPELPVIFSGGQTAAPGRAAGPAWVLKGEEALASIPEGVILVAPTASPKYARLAGRVNGLVTEMGSVTSHLASVAREFAIPLIVGARGALAAIPQGTPVTLDADSAIVYLSLDGESYAFLSKDYLNLSARFGYHFTNLDTLCGDQGSQNYITLQFSGGAGNFLGRSLRVLFLEMVLKRLGFEASAQGDLLEASLTGFDRGPLEDKLDQLGRLLASTRLLDMALSRPEDVERLANRFFVGDYDFLSGDRGDKLPGFYIQEGDWEVKEIEGNPVYCQDGSRAGFRVSTGMAKWVGKVAGPGLQEFLDRMEAYYYFPLILAKDSDLSEGTIRAEVKTIGGHIDRAGGIVFGLRSLGNYFVWRLNALEDNLILFEYENHKREQRGISKQKIESDRWYALKAEINGRTIRAYLDEVVILAYETETPLRGYAGLWTKADSVTLFRNFIFQR